MPVSEHAVEVIIVNDRLAVIEEQVRQNAADTIALLHEAFVGDLWEGRYHSYEDWLQRQFGWDLNYVRELLNTRLPPRLRQKEIWELPWPEASESEVNIGDLLANAEAAGSDAVAELARSRAEVLERELDEIEAREEIEDDRARFERSLARSRSIAREAFHFGAPRERIEPALRTVVEILCEYAGPKVGVGLAEAVTKMLPGKAKTAG